MRGWVLVLVAMAGGCGASAPPLPACEQAEGFVQVNTVDGAPTIAGLELEMGPCIVSAGCRPASSTQVASADAPCAHVTVLVAGAGTVCGLKLTSVDHRVVVEAATLRGIEGTDFQCSDLGRPVTAFRTALEPTLITVDFSKGTPAP